MKKFLAILATGLVMALSATSVFAAGSIKEEGVTVEGNYNVGKLSPTEKTEVSTYAADLAAKNDSIPEEYNIYALEISVPDGGNLTESTTITITTPGTKAGQKAIILHKGAKGWESWEALEVGDNFVKAKFDSLSPVAVVVYDAPVPPVPPIDDDDDDDEPVAATSPKTGVLPVAAFAATICLAGAAVCGKKVK